MEWWMWGLTILAALLIIFLFVFFIIYCRVIIPKQKTKKDEQMGQMEEMWRKELEEKGLSPVEIEQIIEQRKQTMLLKQQVNAQTATTFTLGGGPFFHALNNDKKD